MQITDLFQQFGGVNNSAANTAPATGTDNAVSAAEVQQIKDIANQLLAGNVFEATVNDIKNGEVTLGLSNGDTMLARLMANVQLNVGESMFFQVKSNNGLQIDIKPFSMENDGNPALLKALDAAGLKADGKNFSMVNAMMQEQMPIDKSSLQEMARLASANGRINVSTLVEMTKFGIPVTSENAAAFENYKADQNIMAKDLNTLFDQIPAKLGEDGIQAKDSMELHNQIVSLLSDPEDPGSVIIKGQPANNVGIDASNVIGEANEAQAALHTEQSTLQDTGLGKDTATAAGIASETVVSQENEEAAKVNGHAAENIARNNEGVVLKNILDENGLKDLNKALDHLMGNERPENVSGDMTAKELLNVVKNYFASHTDLSSDMVKGLLSGKAYAQVVRAALEDQWLMKPQDITDSEKINQFYEKMDKQMNELQRIVSASGAESPQVTQSASDIQNNINFMNVMNQTYTYVQMPLKFKDQNAQGDLYVYTNKKNLKEKDGELSAFLHLDMEHLGSTDVSVKMKGRNVGTKFYLSDDAAYDLLIAHAPELEERLFKKGYSCKIDVENEEHKVDFVEDFLRKDKPASGLVHRYSFDMRA